MATVTLEPKAIIASTSVMPEALSSCCTYLLERIAQIWQAVCGWITQLFAIEPPPLPSFPKPLPRHLTVHILKFCSPEDNVRVGKTNKFFRQAFNKWLQQVQRLEFVCNAAFWNSLQAEIFSSPLPALRSLTFHIQIWNPNATFIDKHTFMQNWVKHAPQLTAIHLKGDSENWRFKRILDLLPEFSQLQEVSLELNTHDMVLEAGKIPQLKNLSISNVRAWTITHLFNTFAARETLEALAIPIDETPEETMQKISSFPRLKSVTLFNYFYNRSLLHLFNLPALRELHFRRGSLHGILLDLPENHLEVLTIRDCEYAPANKSGFETLARCKNLRRLHLQPLKHHLYVDNEWHGDLFPHLAICSSLEDLTLENFLLNKSATQDLLALIEKLPNLRELDISKCFGKIDKEAVKLAASARSPSLSYKLPA